MQQGTNTTFSEAKPADLINELINNYKTRCHYLWLIFILEYFYLNPVLQDSDTQKYSAYTVVCVSVWIYLNIMYVCVCMCVCVCVCVNLFKYYVHVSVCVWIYLNIMYIWCVFYVPYCTY